ncbi:MAG: ABC transporter ATP-binding protein [Lachnospiraceae bacterium]|nr:ABC transporter ATP-binding protein [Lachnospiraceae bacterium]
MKKIWGYYLRPFYLRMAGGFAIKFLGTWMDLLLPWTLAHMIDTVIPAKEKGQILPWGIFMLGCSVLAVVFNVLANRMASQVASSAIYVIRKDLFEKIMYLSNRQSDELTQPSLISRLTSDTYNVHQMIGRMQRLGVRAPILLIGGVAMTMMLDRVLSCVLLATLPFLTAVVLLVSRKSVPLFTGLQESTDRFVRLVREDIAGIRVIKALSKEGYEQERFDQANREVAKRERKATMLAAVTNPSMNILLNMGLVAVVCVGAVQVDRGFSETGKILAFMTYFTIILNALLSISRMFMVFSKAAASAGRIVEVLELEDERDLERAKVGQGEKETWHKGAGQRSLQQPSPHVEFENVSFSYNGTSNNLENISFSLGRGEVLGIIGATGSGKSTIAQLLMRFYDVDKGAIKIDGQDLRSMDLQSLRTRFGVVLQNDMLFGGGIYENIDMGRGLANEQVWEAIGYARAKGFVEEKGGLGAKLDIRGANLSGGQRQRLLIARALAAGPDILILDDSSSALDYKTDAELRKGLRERYPNTTCVVIAQRISSVMGACHILVLEDGKAVGYGTHRELMESCAIYREISQSQTGCGA